MDTMYFVACERLRGGRPFSYQKAGRRVQVSRYVAPPQDALDDAEQLVEFARAAIAAAAVAPRRGSRPTSA